MAKKSRRKTQGRCVFCGGTRLSKEHIWSDWLKNHVQRGPGHFFASVGYQYDRSVGTPERTAPYRQQAKQGSAMQRKVRRVCIDCNTGWMCRTVERAKPTALRLLKGETFSLSRTDLDGLVAWIALSLAMEAQDVTGDCNAIQSTDLAALVGGNPPNRNWSLWIANYVGEEYRDFNHVSLDVVAGRKSTGESADVHSVTDYLQVSTFVIGNMAVHAFISTRDDITRAYLREVTGFPVALKLWPDPPTFAEWPPPWGMLDTDIDCLTFGWVRRIARLPGITFHRQRFPKSIQHLFDSLVIDVIPP